jgi:DNA-binding response OmpR family regulator
MATTLLLVESKTAGSKSLERGLSRADYSVLLANTGYEAIELVTRERPDIVIVDASTMRSSGVRICRRIRSASKGLPLIHCRDSNTQLDRSAGADLYISQPFTSRKVLNRIRVLLPIDDLKEIVVRAGGITYYPSKRSVNVDGRGEKRLTPKLAALLEQFLLHPNEVLGRKYLMIHVWKTNYFGDTRTLDVHMRWIREIIEQDPAKPKIIRTIRSVGYIFSLPSQS